MFTNLHQHFKIPSALRFKVMSFDITDSYIIYGEVAEVRGVSHFVKYGKEVLEKGIIKNGLIIDQNKLENIFLELRRKLKFNFVRLAIESNNSEEIGKYLDIFKRVKITPVAFVERRQALANALINKNENKRVLILDIDADNNLSVVLYVFGKVYSLGKIKHDFENLYVDISDLILDWNIKNSKNIKLESLDYAILNSLNIDNIEAIPLLEKILKIRVFKSNVWVNVLDIEKHIPDLSYRDSIFYSVVIGLCVVDDFDFLNKKLSKRVNSEYYIRLWTTILNTIAVVFVVASLSILPSYFISGLKIDLAKDQFLKTLDKSGGLDDNSMSLLTSSINSKIENIDKDIKNLEMSKVLNVLFVKDSGISYEDLILNKENNLVKFEIFGISKNKTSLDKFILLVKDNFANANIIYKENEINNIKFNLKFDIADE